MSAKKIRKQVNSLTGRIVGVCRSVLQTEHEGNVSGHASRQAESNPTNKDSKYRHLTALQEQKKTARALLA
jgi:hypothetical protein